MTDIPSAHDALVEGLRANGFGDNTELVAAVEELTAAGDLFNNALSSPRGVLGGPSYDHMTELSRTMGKITESLTVVIAAIAPQGEPL